MVSGVLVRTPGVVRGLLEGLPEAWLHGTEGGDTSRADVCAQVGCGKQKPAMIVSRNGKRPRMGSER